MGSNSGSGISSPSSVGFQLIKTSGLMILSRMYFGISSYSSFPVFPGFGGGYIEGGEERVFVFIFDDDDVVIVVVVVVAPSSSSSPSSSSISSPLLLSLLLPSSPLLFEEEEDKYAPSFGIFLSTIDDEEEEEKGQAPNEQTERERDVRLCLRARAGSSRFSLYI